MDIWCVQNQAPINPRGRNLMRGLKILLVFLSAMLLVAPAFSQGTNATVTGTIADSTGALIPGVSVTATNTATGVVNTVITNETGSYNFPTLLPGAYKLSAELSG